MTEHSNIDSIIHKFLEQKATAEEEKQLATWVAESKTNADHLKAMQKLHMSTIMKTTQEPDANEAFEALNQPDNLKQGKSRSLFITVASIAASIIIIVSIWQGVNHTPKKSYKLSDVTTEWPIMDSLQELTLADDSKLTLAPNSFTQTFNEVNPNRFLYLNGKAFFDVESDSTRPFTVSAGHVKVIVLGTQFEVDYDKPTKTVIVSVTEGKVRVEDRFIDQHMILTAGQKGIFKEDFDPIQESIQNENYLVWRTGKLQFTNTPLQNALQDISTYLNKPVILKSEDLNNQALNVKFDNASEEHIQGVLEAMLSVKFEKSGDTLYISK
jgi:transmembrane sensor